MPDVQRPTTISHSSFTGTLLRLWWSVGGTAALLIFVLLIAQDSEGAVTWRDGAAALVLASIGLARYVDIRHFGGETGDGKPATMADLRKHMAILAVAGVVAIGIAHVVAG